jgi:hypothetical protein
VAVSRMVLKRRPSPPAWWIRRVIEVLQAAGS